MFNPKGKPAGVHTCSRCEEECTTYTLGPSRVIGTSPRHYTCTNCLIINMVRYATFMNAGSIHKFGTCPQFNIATSQFVDMKYGSIELTLVGSKMVNINGIHRPAPDITKTEDTIVTGIAYSQDYLLTVSNNAPFPVEEMEKNEGLDLYFEALIKHTLEELYDEIDSLIGEGDESDA